MRERATQETRTKLLTRDLRRMLASIAVGTLDCERCGRRASTVVRAAKGAPKAMCKTCSQRAAVGRTIELWEAQ